MRKSTKSVFRYDWEEKLLERARELYEHGEGELTFRVRIPQGKRKKSKQVIVSGGQTTRFEEEI